MVTLDPTERDNFIISGNIVSEVITGSITHTILFGAELINTENKNLRYDTNWSTTDDDNEIFNISRPMDFTVNSAGVATAVNFTNSLKSKTESDISVTSLFIQDQMDLTDNIKLMIGGRLDSFDITVDDIKNGTSESRTDDRFSPRAGVIYKPQDSVSLYMSYSESFLPRSGEQFKSLSATSARLDPDVFESTELGVKVAITDTLSFTAAIFDSEQTRATYDNVTGENSEIRGLQVDGIELELRGQVSDKLELAVGYSSLDGTTSSGGVAREVPDHTFSLFAKYQVDENFGWALGVTQQGESHIKDNSTLILPEYTRFDFAAYWNVSDDMVLRLNVENLSDELYFPHSHSTHQASVGEPLNARVSLTKTFY